jgi:hypothetical protein
MLTLHATESFASWFQALTDAEAEEVATGIELIAALGPEQAPPRSSELLLWYQCPPASVSINPRLMRRFVMFSEFSARLRKALTALDSEPVRRKLAEASDERALVALATLRRVAASASFRHVYGSAEPSWQEVEALCRRVYEALGMSEAPTPPSNGVRGLTIDTCKPAIRVLYGVDSARSRGLLITGERLDRYAYGPSVRRALALFSQFLNSSSESPSEWSTR